MAAAASRCQQSVRDQAGPESTDGVLQRAQQRQHED
jgi:hypothetical protein